MHGALCANELEHRGGLCDALLRPARHPRARMHQRLGVARQEAVVDEEVLFDPKAPIASLEVAGTIVAHAVTQREVLRAGRRPDRVRLHEAETLDRPCEGGRREQAARDCVAAQVREGQRHRGIMP